MYTRPQVEYNGGMTDKSIFKKGRISTSGAGPLTRMVMANTGNTYPLRRKRIYAKSAGLCYRQATHPLVINPETMTTFGPAGTLYANMGTAVHDVVEKAFEKSGNLVYAESYAPDVGLNIGGYIDAIVRLNGKERIIEVKTCGNLPSKPKRDHAAQALTYVVLSGIRNPILFYLSRSVADYTGKLITAELEVVHTDDDLRRTAIQMAAAHYSSSLGVLPPKPMHLRVKSHCGFCPLIRNCWEEHPFTPDIKHVTEKQWARISDMANKKADELLDTMDERKSDFLTHLEKKKNAKTVSK